MPNASSVAALIQTVFQVNHAKADYAVRALQAHAALQVIARPIQIVSMAPAATAAPSTLAAPLLRCAALGTACLQRQWCAAETVIAPRVSAVSWEAASRKLVQLTLITSRGSIRIEWGHLSFMPM
jgi:hypothetical protein